MSVCKTVQMFTQVPCPYCSIITIFCVVLLVILSFYSILIVLMVKFMKHKNLNQNMLPLLHKTVEFSYLKGHGAALCFAMLIVLYCTMSSDRAVYRSIKYHVHICNKF